MADLSEQIVTGRKNFIHMMKDVREVAGTIEIHLAAGGKLGELPEAEEMVQLAVILLTSIPSYSILEDLHQEDLNRIQEN